MTSSGLQSTDVCKSKLNDCEYANVQHLKFQKVFCRIFISLSLTVSIREIFIRGNNIKVLNIH